MLTDLEQRLATVLGNELPAPFGGRVRVAPDTPPGSGPSVMVSVSRAVPLPTDFGSVRPEAVPAPPERQRVVRLRCTLEILVEPEASEGRPQLVDAVDALLYLLGDDAFRSARALVEDGDQGFVLDSLLLEEVAPGLRADDDAPPHLTLRAEGWFWPVGTEAEAGVEIVEARVRQVTLPLGAGSLPATITAGGEAVELRFAPDTAGTLRLRSDGTESEAFGPLAVRLLGEAGGAGAGALAGGDDGPGGSRLLELTDGVATATYTPPADPAVDRVLVHMVEGDADALGLEIARFTLVVEAGA